MKILFAVNDIFLGEPIGVLQLSACLKEFGHQTKLIPLNKTSFRDMLISYAPDIIAYSAMTPESDYFIDADKIAIRWMRESGKKAFRIMGGAHPTYFPEILEEMHLDAICIGEGDKALPEVITRFEKGLSLNGIPNILVKDGNINDMTKELIDDLDLLPDIDREIYYEAMPVYRSLRMRGFMIGRGCPYDCSYCHNHAFKELFKGCGKILRRRSVERTIREIKNVLNQYPSVKLIKLSDDTFAHKIDEWLITFLERYRKEINKPFYCLMRSNTLTEEMAKLLKNSGCVSIGMSVESGNERIRNDILKRGLSDDLVINSFKYARVNMIKTYGNTILAIPGTKFSDDWESFLFMKKLRMTAPTFGIFNPYPKTMLTDYAIQRGYLSANYKGNNIYGYKSPLNCYSDKEKEMQLRLVYLGPLFCALPNFCIPLLKILLNINLNIFYRYIGSSYLILKTGLSIFPGIYPNNPIKISRIFLESIKFFAPKEK